MYKAPFPYFGGKSSVAETVWKRFGDVPNYVEPFAGSCAVLLNRPHWPWGDNRTETVNDADGLLANFWRALKHDPDAVAEHCDWPVNELDLHARHSWLTNVGREQVERLRTDPDYYDAKIAGWWVWGISCWIGGGWCYHPEWKQLPHLGGAGMGVHRASVVDLREYLRNLSERFRRVRVCCGDWSRVCGKSPTLCLGLTGIFLDPPYTKEAGRAGGIYTTDDESVGHQVAAWCLANGDNPKMRIALCGYEGEYDIPGDWECFAWKAHGGYGNQAEKNGRANANLERIWFSPHCLMPTKERMLF